MILIQPFLPSWPVRNLISSSIFIFVRTETNARRKKIHLLEICLFFSDASLFYPLKGESVLEKVTFTEEPVPKINDDFMYTVDIAPMMQALPRLELKKGAPLATPQDSQGETFFRRKYNIFSQSFGYMYGTTTNPAPAPAPQTQKPPSTPVAKPVVQAIDSPEMLISAPLSGTFRHEGHMGFNKDTGQFEVHGLPNEWNTMLASINTAMQKQGQESLSHEEVNYLVNVLKSVDTKDPADEKVEVIYDYDAVDESELTLRVGYIVTVFEKDECGWWYGRYDDQEGFFPGSYVQPLQDMIPEPPAEPLSVPPPPPVALERATEHQNAKPITLPTSIATATAKTSTPAKVATQTNTTVPIPPPMPSTNASAAVVSPARAASRSESASSPGSAPSVPAPIQASTRNELLDSIRKGTKLRAFRAEEQSTAGNRTEEQLMKALMRLRRNIADDEDDD
eukprot:TRINITY_DN7484_c0_g1_i2.p1 TRINITY_DN7484_c0_g1~~TRINITY_DN7484_c0_g1_i2.p1  ORF type:complete len:451 (+),score=89.36 TRINITY_DN7484_c0_g1_i2:674-2026(+)